MWILKRYVEFKQIEGKRVSSSQKKRTLGEGGMLKNKQGQTREEGGGQNSGILRERTF